MNAIDSASRVCWDRPRLVISWLVWLAAVLAAFQPYGGFLAMILIVVGGFLRPRSVRVWSERHLLKAAIALLVGFPLVAVYLGSPAAQEFMRSLVGILLLTVLWIIDTALDFSSYRSLRPLL